MDVDDFDARYFLPYLPNLEIIYYDEIVQVKL